MSIITCENCKNQIPSTRRSDAIYCCNECGWAYRNEKKKTGNTEKRKASAPLEQNYKIIKDLHDRGIHDLSKEALIVSGFDFETYTGIADIDPATKTTEYKLFDFFFKIHGDRVTLKK